MVLRRRTVAIGAAIASFLGTLVAGAIAAGSGPSDAAALQPARDKPDKGIEKKVDGLVQQMTLQEKLMQLQLDADWQATDDQAKAGLGGVFSLTDPAKIRPPPARRGGAVAAAHPDPVRLRHDPRLPHDLSDPARHRVVVGSFAR